MKRAFWLVLLPAMVVLALRSGTDFSGAGAVAAPPLSLEGLLDEKLPEATEDDVKMTVDNSACYVCHDNYQREEMVLQHGTNEVGCIDCHGQSFEHRDDEDNITPPDKMYAAEDIDKMCAECHEEHDVAAVKVLARWRQRCPAKTDPEAIVCTDCHGDHRLKFRTVWWDKKTRELIIRKEGQRIKVADDLTGDEPEHPASDDVSPDLEMR